MKKTLYPLILCFLFLGQVTAQVYTNKPVGQKNASLIDSLKAQPYPYILPIWGEKAAKLGFQLPYSAGVSINYLTQESELAINNLAVGFNNGPMYNLDEIVRFDGATAAADILSIRPDIWLFPFLNVYSILGTAKTSTAINAGIFIPDTSNNWHEIASFSTKANFTATSFGLGATPTFGVGGGWMALDLNVTWTDVSALDKPVFTFVFGPRLGKTIQLKKSDMNIAFWAGGFRVQLSSSTAGSIKLADIMPPNELQGKVDNGLVKVEEATVQVDAWWNGLSSLEQKNPINMAKYETANRAIESAGNLLNSMDAALNDGESASVQYSLEKTLLDKWNFVIGSQFQLNKHFMIRAEYGFLGSRTQFMTGLQYRFGL